MIEIRQFEVGSLIKSGGRLVNLSSAGHRFSDVDLEDPNFEHTPYTEFGAKGVGEGGAIAPPAALFNAVNDALSPLGALVSETPLTPRRLLAAIEAAKAAAREKAEAAAEPVHEVIR